MNQAHYILLRDKLLPDYKSAHHHVVAMYSASDAKKYLQGRNMHAGICHSANITYHEKIAETDWVQHFKRTFMGFWGRTPISAVYFYEITHALETRIYIMEQLVANYEKGVIEPQLNISHPGDRVRIY